MRVSSCSQVRLTRMLREGCIFSEVSISIAEGGVKLGRDNILILIYLDNIILT